MNRKFIFEGSRQVLNITSKRYKDFPEQKMQQGRKMDEDIW